MVYWFSIDNGITPSGFVLCAAKDFDNVGLTFFGKKRLLDAFTEAKELL